MSAQIVSRDEAILRGLNRYFTGRACRHGHVAERRVSNGNCHECDSQKIRPIPHPRELLGRDLREPENARWPDNGRVEIVVDPNWLIDGQPRVVRRVGWRNCMCCKRRMFSADIAKIRICDQCKDVQTDMSNGARRILPRAKRVARIDGFISAAESRADL